MRPWTTSLADYLFSASSPLLEGLEDEVDRENAVALANSWCSWTGAPFSDVSFHYWGFNGDFYGPSAFVPDGYAQFVQYLMHDDPKISARARGDRDLGGLRLCPHHGARHGLSRPVIHMHDTPGSTQTSSSSLHATIATATARSY